MIFDNVEGGMEALQYQHSPRFAEDLDRTFRTVRLSDSVNVAELRDSTLVKVVRHHTDINVRVELTDGGDLFSTPPLLDKNHPLIHRWARNVTSNRDARDLMTSGPIVNGGVSRKTGKVLGDFKEPEHVIWLPRELASKGSILTVAEMTAIFLHEMGHGFTFFELLGRTTTTDFAIDFAVRNLLGEENETRRYEIMDAIDKQPGLVISDRGALEACKSPEEISIVILNDAVISSRSELGENVYDPRSSEALADQYVAMFGRGRDLATAVDKLTRAGMSYDHWYRPLHWGIQAAQASAAVVLAVYAPVVAVPAILGMTMFYTNSGNLTDSPKKRYGNIINDLRLALKNEKIKLRRMAYLNDIEVVQKLMKDTNDHESLYRFMANNLFPRGRGLARAVDIQRKLEAMLHNSLFEGEERLKQLL